MPRASKDMTDAHRLIAERVKGLPKNYLDCRDPGLAHAWQREKDFHVIEQAVEPGSKGKILFLGRDSICMRCNTAKHEQFMIGKNGMEKIRMSYAYPDGYQMPGVPRGVKASTIIWQENYRRAMEEAANAAAGERERAEA